MVNAERKAEEASAEDMRGAPSDTASDAIARKREEDLNRILYGMRFRRILRDAVFTLIVVAAAAVLVATLWMPVLRIYGQSMSPTLVDGDIVISTKAGKFGEGELVAFYYNNKILVKRVIAESGDWVNIDEEGNVFVNDVALEEPYIDEKALGDCNITLPYQVPEGKLFVMGDNRATSVDSRNTAVGCVAEEQFVGKLVFVVWPLSSFGEVR